MANSGLVYPGSAGFTQFPMLGLSPISPLYSSLYPYQPGFFSMYLPGYTYRPMLLLVAPTVVRNPTLVYSPYSQNRPGISPVGTPVRPYPSSVPSYVVRPAPVPIHTAPVPVIRPTAPAVHAAPAAPHVGVHK
jgi:hypothetical protein